MSDSHAPHAVLRGHRHRLKASVFHPDSVRFGRSAHDHRARIRRMRVESGEQLLVLRGYEGWVYDIAFSPDGVLALTAFEDGLVKVWDTGGSRMRLFLSR